MNIETFFIYFLSEDKFVVFHPVKRRNSNFEIASWLHNHRKGRDFIALMPRVYLTVSIPFSKSLSTPSRPWSFLCFLRFTIKWALQLTQIHPSPVKIQHSSSTDSWASSILSKYSLLWAQSVATLVWHTIAYCPFFFKIILISGSRCTTFVRFEVYIFSVIVMSLNITIRNPLSQKLIFFSILIINTALNFYRFLIDKTYFPQHIVSNWIKP